MSCSSSVCSGEARCAAASFAVAVNGMARHGGTRFAVVLPGCVRFGVAGFGPAILDVEWLGSLEMGGVGCGMARLGADRYWLGSLRRVGVLVVLGVGWFRFGFG
jgi:hypothetical protein